MKCLRCGYCCVSYDVMIIDPNFINKIKKYSDVKPKFIIYKKSGEICPYLEIKNNIAYCKIHSYKWFRKTPCGNHTQIEKENSDCRMGSYLLKLYTPKQITERFCTNGDH